MAGQDRSRDDRDRYGRRGQERDWRAGPDERGHAYGDEDRDYGRYGFAGQRGYRPDDDRYGGARQGSRDPGGSDRGGFTGGGYGQRESVNRDRFRQDAGGDEGSRDRGRSDWGRESGTRYGSGYGSDQGGGEDRSYGDFRRSGDDDRYQDPSQRNWFERAGDEVASWFGDEEAGRRRQQDHRGRGPKGYTRSDDRIREDVSDRLADDPRIDASEIDVSVSGGEVTLSGTVDSRTTRRRAEDLIEQVSGVRHVQNNLRVRQQAGSGTQAASSSTSTTTRDTSGSTGTSGSATASGAGMFGNEAGIGGSRRTDA